MAIEITGRHENVTESMRAYAQTKIERVVEDYPTVDTVHVILDVQKYRQIAEVVVHGHHHLRLDAREVSEDMYASIDALMDKIERQLQKTRGKWQAKRVHGKALRAAGEGGA